MEQTPDMSIIENEFVRKLKMPCWNESSGSTLLPSSTMENRDEEDLSICDRRKVQGVLPCTSATLGKVGSQHETITIAEQTKCPCCQQSFDNRPSTLNEPRLLKHHTLSLFTLSDEENSDVNNINEDMLPGALSEGIYYHPTGVLVQGWLHKKGTGKDWLGSTSWKGRWARVITAKVDGYYCEVPLMQIYWHSSSPVPSTVILLESTVVLAMDLDDKDQWDSFQFEIRHAATKENPTLSVTRTFTAPKLSRDTWVYMISEALLLFEKNMAIYKKSAFSACGGVRILSRPAPQPPMRARSNRGMPSKQRPSRPPSRLPVPRPNRTTRASDMTEQPLRSTIPRLVNENNSESKPDARTDINDWYVYPPDIPRRGLGIKLML